jgi:hypothetical protein
VSRWIGIITCGRKRRIRKIRRTRRILGKLNRTKAHSGNHKCRPDERNGLNKDIGCNDDSSHIPA